MSRTASGTLAEIEIFRHSARVTDAVLQANLQGITHEDSLLQPRPGGNCLNWVLGHLVWAYDSSLPLLGRRPVMEPEVIGRYARGGAPLLEPGEAVDFGRLLDAWREGVERFAAGLESLTPEVLDRPAPSSPTDDPDETVRSLLSTLCFHQAYHAGQAAILRRLVGKEGAIK